MLDPISYSSDSQANGIFLQVPLAIYGDDDERYVGGLVLEPGDDNAYGDIWEAEDIRLMSLRFMEKSQHIDYMHTSKVVAQPVESVYFPTESEGGQESYKFWDVDIKGGSWWLGSKVTDDQAWEEVKSGDLAGYSIFAVKTPGLEQAASTVGARYFAQQANAAPTTEAPSGRKMSAHEWDVTMVALVDKPAVRKAVFVAMRRDSTGIQYKDPTGVALPGPVREVVGQMVETIIQNKGVGNMKFSKFLSYLANEGGTGALALADPETDPSTTPKPEGDGAGDGAPTGDPAGQGDGETEPVTLESIAKTLGELADKGVGAVADVQALITEAVAPLLAKIEKLETRTASQSGIGAIPIGASDDGDEEDQTPGKPKREDDWVNYGTAPSKRPKRGS